MTQDHDTLTQRRVKREIPYWRVIFEFDAPPPNVIGVDVKGSTIIGRNVEEIGLVVDLDTGVFRSESKGVSRKHAALMPDKDGVLIVDIGSTNGTYVNDELLEAGTRTRIAAGDVIRMSELTMTVRIITRLRESHSAALDS